MGMDIRDALRKVVGMHDLTYEEMSSCMEYILAGGASDILVASLLTALRMKGESMDELNAMLDVMLRHAVRVKVSGHVIDTAGTGGDNSGTFNISTAAAFIASASGVRVAKHGNRAVSSMSGSADVLEYLGYDLDASAERVGECIERIGIGFIFAPRFHPAMSRVAHVRREMGIRTAFNIVGPVCNPAMPRAQVVGVYSPSVMEKVAGMLMHAGREEFMVVHAMDGMDEFSNTCINRVLWYRRETGRVQAMDIDPSVLGISTASREDLMVRSRDEAAMVFLDVLNGRARREVMDAVLLNAAAALIVGRRVESFDEGIETARASVRDGGAYKRLRELIAACGSIGRLEEVEDMASKGP
ncbi:MAG: anthranilate phosphoribosyltransferase [Candidatus Nitrosocaldus sp.]|nr:anthranilate phosphoribosyltransferase [Candidatus Nitrosocaldus sp.]